MKTMLYHTQLDDLSSLGNMRIKLTREQFEWLAEGSSNSQSNLELLAKHYIDGIELKELSIEAGFSSPARIYTLVKRFEAFVQKKLEDSSTEISAIIHPLGETRFSKFDISNK